MKVVFMGSAEFAAPALLKLIESKHEIVAVYTKIFSNLVKEQSTIYKLAKKFGLNIITPTTLKTLKNIQQLQLLKPDIGVVAAYGLLIPKELFVVPRFGFINIHPSALPRWRGAAPIERTIMAGDKKSSVCIIKIDQGLDTGDIILRKDFLLSDTTTREELYRECSTLGGEMVLEVLDSFIKNSVSYAKQSTRGITYADKIQSKERKLNFCLLASQVNNKIRAFSPRPGAYFVYRNELVRIISAVIKEVNNTYKAGTVINNQLSIACIDNIIQPTLVQRSGKKMIYTDAFLRGFNIPAGTQL